MKKLVLLCTMLATLSCLAFAEYQVNLPGYEAAKDRYYQLIDKVVDGSATYMEAAEFSDLCQVYGFDLPISEPAEDRSGENLDQGGGDCGNPWVITECPFLDTGFFDGDDDCQLSSASPYNDVFYQFTAPYTGYYQMRARSYTTGVAAIRVVSGACCTGGTSMTFSSNSVATSCKNPIAPGMEPGTVVTYVWAYFTQGVTYWIHVGTSSNTVSTAAYEFDLWCILPPTMEPEAVHNTCATAWEIACNDSITGDSSSSTVLDWYKVVVPDYSPMACSLKVFVGGREMGHYNSGRYPTYTGTAPYSVDGRFTLYKERAGETCVYDSVTYASDAGCSYDAGRTVAVGPGTYYIKVWNSNLYDYVLTTACIEYDSSTACCFLDGQCSDQFKSVCEAAGGWSRPVGVQCASNPCPEGPCPYESRDTEPNNTCDPSRLEVICNSWYCGVITPATDVDWYKFVVPEAVCESVVVDIFANATTGMWPYNQGLNPYVYLYASDCVTSLAYNNDNSGTAPDPMGTDSRLKKALGPGTYYIKVYSYNSATTGPYEMHITCITRECLVPDFCWNAITVGVPSSTAGTTVGYTVDTPPLCRFAPTSPGVWYKVTGSDFMVSADVCINGFSSSDSRLNVYRGDCNNLICVTANDDTSLCVGHTLASLVSWCAREGVDYYILVHGYSSYTGTFTLNITQGDYCGTGACCFSDGHCEQMTQDGCASALGTFRGNGTVCDPNPCPMPCLWPNRDTEPVNNTCGPDDPLAACADTLCGAIAAVGDTDWYKLVLTDCDTVIIRVYANDTPGWPSCYNQGLDPMVWLYKENCTTLVGSNDDFYGTAPEPVSDDSKLTIACLYHGTYYIKVAAASYPAGGFGPYVMTLECHQCECPDLTGDVCADPRIITAIPYSDTRSTCLFTDDYNATCLGYYDGAKDVIYRLDVPAGGGIYRVSMTTVTDDDGGILLDDACPPDASTCLGMDNTGGSDGKTFTINCISLAEGSYYIMVDNWPSPACITSYTMQVTSCGVGRCCYGTDPLHPLCAENTEAECQALSGTWTAGSTCSVPCPTPCPYPDRDQEDLNDVCGPTVPAVFCGDTLCGVIDATGESDWYQITIPEGVCDTIVVKVFADDTPTLWPYGKGLDPAVYLYDATCTNQLAYQDDNNGTYPPDPAHFDSKIKKGCLPAGTYYIRVTGPYTGVGPYLLVVECIPCECPHPCESYTLCGSPGEVEVNNTCPPPVQQAEITCDATVYGLHCPTTDTDFWKVTIPPMTIMTIMVYTGPTCSVNPPAGVYARYYDDLCASPTSGGTAAIVITNNTANPLVKYLEVYDNGGQSQTLYKVTATCCYVRNYCADPIITGAGTYAAGFWTFDSTVNTCCATRAVDTTYAWGCAGTHWVAGPSVVFRFTLASTNVLDIVATSPLSEDIQFHLFTDCAAPMTSCVASEDDGGTAEDTLGIVLPAGTYYVAVMRYGAANCGDLHLHIKSDCPLPVNLLGDVVATPGSEKVTLTWATASETNSDRFEIVRNGRMIGRVSAAGTSPSRHDYSWAEEGLNNGMTYTYTLRSVDINGRALDLATVSATPNFAAGEVTEYALHQNYPNPFNPVTTIAFDLLEAGNVNLKIYNLVGQEVRTAMSGMMPKGRHTVSFDAGDLASGIYLYRIEVNGFAAEKKMLLMK